MLKTPRRKETPLADAVKEVILKTDPSPVKDFIRRGLNFLKKDADDIREANGEKRIN